MKNFSEKLTMALAVLSPIIAVIFIWCAYLYLPQKEKTHFETKPNSQLQLFQSFEDTKEVTLPRTSTTKI